MSAYPPPTEITPIFNGITFTSNDEFLQLVAQSNEDMNGKSIVNLNSLIFSDTTIQTTAYTGAVNNDITPNSVVITPTANPPDASTTIQNYYNNGANYSLNIQTPYYYPANVPSSRRQNFVDICWDNSIASSIYQNVVIEYKHYLRPDTNSVSQPANGTMLFYDYGTICFSIGWLKQQFPSGLNVNSVNNENITLNPCSRGSSNNGNWVMNANIQLQYYGTSNNRITIWYDNEPFDASGYTGICNTWSSFSAKINNTGGNVSAGYVDNPVWFEVNSTTIP